MTKEIKKYYKYLDLPYDATEQDALTREKAIIKVLRAKAIKQKKNYNEEINKVAEYTNKVIENIKNNGVGIERQIFSSNGERVISLTFALVVVIIMFISSLIAII